MVTKAVTSVALEISSDSSPPVTTSRSLDAIWPRGWPRSGTCRRPPWEQDGDLLVVGGSVDTVKMREWVRVPCRRGCLTQ